MGGRPDKPGNSGVENPESRQISPLGQAIRYFREDQRLTQDALADLAEIDKQRISDIERGETRSLHGPTLKKICDGLTISLEELRAKERELSRAASTDTPRQGCARPELPQAGLIHNDIRPVPGFTGREDLLDAIDAALWQKGGTAALTDIGAGAPEASNQPSPTAQQLPLPGGEGGGEGLRTIGEALPPHPVPLPTGEGTRGGRASMSHTSPVGEGTRRARRGDETSRAAVKGLGGVGKSVLAREYAWRTRKRYHGVWWVRAETEQTLIDDLIDLGSRLIPNLKEVQERDRALHLALDAIAGAGGGKPWLIVYDNVEKPGDIRKLTPKTGAHILITSRWPRWQGHAQELPVDVFPEETAVDFLLAEAPHETREAAGRLAAALGWLPLALSHARAYCAETNLSFDDYARRLSELIQEAPEDAEYPASVFATFSLAIAKAAEACPEAEKLMEIAAFLASERIPLDIILDKVMSKRRREKAVGTLFKMSLISHAEIEDGAHAITVHRLLQEVMRAVLSYQSVDGAIIVLKLMAQAFGERRKSLYHRNWPRLKKLVPHAVALLNIAPPLEHTRFIAYTIGRYLGYQAAYKEAEGLCWRAMAIAEKIYGPDDVGVGSCLSAIGEIYLHQDRIDEAEPLYSRTLDIYENALGKEHIFTAHCLRYLTLIYNRQNRYNRALIFCNLALNIYENSVQTLSDADQLDCCFGLAQCLTDLAAIYRAQGRDAEAEPLYKRALVLVEDAFGNFHPELSIIRADLANLYHIQQRYEEAASFYESSVGIAKVAWGEKHPRTGECHFGLASTYSDQGRYEEAEPHYANALEILEKALGPNHSTTQKVRATYARSRELKGIDL